MKRDYEVVVLLDPDLSDDGVKDEIAKVERTIASRGGAVKKLDIWGRRRLAYKINKKEFAIYVLMVFDGDNSLVAELERQFRISEVVVRFLCVRKDKYAPDFTARLQDELEEELVDVIKGDEEFLDADEFGQVESISR